MTYNLEGSSIDRLKAAGFKRPCGVNDLSSENALLLEFDTGVDAATAKSPLGAKLLQMFVPGIRIHVHLVINSWCKI